MRRTLFIIIILSSVAASAQRVTRNFNNVVMPEALRQLNRMQNRYTINFIFNDLEDFRVTANVKGALVPQAIRQLIGFYPMDMTMVSDSIINVECTQKTLRRYKGRIVDTGGHPVAFANVALLSPTDSVLLAGGVSNADGFFVIPCDAHPVVARVSCLGYKRAERVCASPNLGTVRLSPDQIALKTVTVKGHRPQYKMTTGGVTVEVQHSLLKDVGTAADLLSMLPNVQATDGHFTVFAKGTPDIYINNKKVRDPKELALLKSADIKSVDIITSPGARYGADVNAVIRIKTLRPQGDGVSVEAFGQVRNDAKWTTYDDLSLKYRQRGLELFGTVGFSNSQHSEDNTVRNDIYSNGNHIRIDQYAPSSFWMTDLSGEIGANYDINEDNCVGMKYGLEHSLYMKGGADARQAITGNGLPEGFVDQQMRSSGTDGPDHEFNSYYVGKLGKLGVDFNCSWVWNKEQWVNASTERSSELGDRNVRVVTGNHRNMLAGKVLLTYPVWKGELSLGSELSRTHSTGTNADEGHYVKSSDDDITEKNHACFAEYALHLGRWTVDGGVRYEHISTDCLSFGQRQEEPSRKYADWFPNVSISWQKDRWSVEMSYNKRVSRPSYRAISSYIQYDNRYTVEGGNPLLRPAIRRNVDLQIVCSWLTLSAGYTHQRDVFFSFGSLYDADKAVVIWNQQNFHRHEAFHASVNAAPTLGFWQPTLTLGFWQQHFPTSQSGVATSLDKPEWDIDLRSWFVVSPAMKAMVYLHYASSNDEGFSRNGHEFRVDMRWQTTFLHDRFTATVFANDIFKTMRKRWTDVYPAAVMSKDAYVYTRNFGVSLSYRFNVSRSRYRGTGAGNAEKSRL